MEHAQIVGTVCYIYVTRLKIYFPASEHSPDISHLRSTAIEESEAHPKGKLKKKKKGLSLRLNEG